MSGEGEEGCLEAPSREVCREMFEKVTEYLNGELAGRSTDRSQCLLAYINLAVRGILV